MMAACCFCLQEASGNKKRKRLHNPACEEERSLLERLLVRCTEKGIADFKETSSGSAVLCYNCQSGLTRRERLRQTLESLETDLFAQAHSLKRVTCVAPQKRPPSGPASSLKAFRDQVEGAAERLSGIPTQSPPLAVSFL